jgi:hypothetical protein
MRISIAPLAVATACTSLGPTPVTTTVSPIPATRAEADVQLGVAPGYFLSAAVAEDPAGAGHPQLSAMIDLGERAKGLTFGGRVIGESGDTQGEPIVGYRRRLDERTAFAGLVSGARGRAEERSSSYQATRLHLEAAGDIQLTRPHRWIELHAIGGASATYLSAKGTYCIDENQQFGVDCPEPPERLTMTEVDGVYPAVNAGLALHLFRHRDGALHGARIYAALAAGGMPQVRAGEDTGIQAFLAAGVGLSVSFGEAR